MVLHQLQFGHSSLCVCVYVFPLDSIALNGLEKSEICNILSSKTTFLVYY